MPFWKRPRRRVRRRTSITKHYLEHKERARAFVHERLTLYNARYNFEFNRVAIRNQRTCWGSCSEYKNLNFSYKILFLSQELADYVIVHELCHLSELNHSPNFWKLVEATTPDYKELRKELRSTSVVGSRKIGPK